MKDKVESVIMKENTGRFKLTYSLTLLEEDLHKELAILGKGNLIEDML